MNAVLRHRHSESLGGTSRPESLSSAELVSVAGGTYQDPPPHIVSYINKHFENPGDNLEATMMMAFELAGVIKTKKEIMKTTKRLERSGLLPTDVKDGEPPQYLVNPATNSEFTDRRDAQCLIELQEGNDTRNTLLLKVREMTELRASLHSDQVKEIVEIRRDYINRRVEFPPVHRIIAVMAGISQPEDPDNKPESRVPQLTRDLALDVYWLILLAEPQDRQADANSEVA